MSEQTVKLRPCPFCGGEAHMTRSPPSSYTKGGPPLSVECMNPECWAQMPWDMTEAKAVDRWNRRHA